MYVCMYLYIYIYIYIYSGMKKYLNLLEFLTFLHKITIKCDLIFVKITPMKKQCLL